MGFEPVRVFEVGKQKLHKESYACRVDYSKAYKLKHDAGVSFIGRVDNEHLQMMLEAVGRCKRQNQRQGQFPE